MIADYGAQQWCAVMFGLAPLPPAFWVALCTDEPGVGWDGIVTATVEPPTGVGYARATLPVPLGWTFSDGGFVSSAQQLRYGVPTGDWGLITHWALLDAQSGGQLWCAEEFLDPIEVTPGIPPVIPVAGLVVALGQALASIADT